MLLVNADGVMAGCIKVSELEIDDIVGIMLTLLILLVLIFLLLLVTVYSTVVVM